MNSFTGPLSSNSYLLLLNIKQLTFMYIYAFCTCVHCVCIHIVCVFMCMSHTSILNDEKMLITLNEMLFQINIPSGYSFQCLATSLREMCRIIWTLLKELNQTSGSLWTYKIRIAKSGTQTYLFCSKYPWEFRKHQICFL